MPALLAAALLALPVALSPPSAAPSAQQATFLPLDDPTDDDGAIKCVFGANDQFVYTAHRDSGTVTRLSLATGVVEASAAVGRSLTFMERRPGFSQLVVLDSVASELVLLTTPGLAVVRRVPLSLSGVTGLAGLTGSTDGRLALVHTADEVAMVNLNAGAVAQQFLLPGSPVALNPLDDSAVVLAADNRTLHALRMTQAGGREICSYDLPTGTPLGVVPLGTPAGAGTLISFGLSGDRSVLGVTLAAVVGSLRTEVRTYDSSSLAPLSQTTFFGLSAGSVALSNDGSRAFYTGFGDLGSFPLGGGTVTAQSPGVFTHAIPGAGRFIVSADEQRALYWSSSSSGAFVLVETQGAASWSIPGPARAYISPARSEQGRRFAAVGGTSLNVIPQAEWLTVIDADAAQPSVLWDVPTAAGPGTDGPFDLAATRGRTAAKTRLVAAALNSDKLVVIDPGTRAVVGELATAPRPFRVFPLEDGTVLAFHLDGTISWVDPSVPLELDRVTLGATPIDGFALPGTSAVWVSTSAGSQTGLHRLDFTPGQLTVGAQAFVDMAPPLSAGLFRFGNLLQVDPQRGLAYLQGQGPGAIAVIDLTGPVPGPLYLPPPVSFTAWGWAGLLLSTDGLTLFSSHQAILNPEPVAYDSAAVTGGEPALRWVGTTGASFGPIGQGTDLHLSRDGAHLFYDVSNAGPAVDVAAIRTSDGGVAASVGDGSTFGLAIQSDRALLGRSTDLAFSRFDGSAFAAAEAIALPRALSGRPRWIEGTSLAWVPSGAMPFLDSEEGIVLVDLADGQVDTLCQGGVPNATGVASEMSFSGSILAGEDFRLTVEGLRANSMFGMLILGSSSAAPYFPGLGIGQFCVGGSIGRFTSQVQLADAAGRHVYDIDSQAIATSIGIVRPQPGETWTFQGWHRDQDSAGNATSNTSTAVEVEFR